MRASRLGVGGSLAVGGLEYLAADPRRVVAAGVVDLLGRLQQRHGRKVPRFVGPGRERCLEPRLELEARHSRFLAWGMPCGPNVTELLDFVSAQIRTPNMADLDTLTLPVLPLNNDVRAPAWS